MVFVVSRPFALHDHPHVWSQFIYRWGLLAGFYVKDMILTRKLLVETYPNSIACQGIPEFRYEVSVAPVVSKPSRMKRPGGKLWILEELAQLNALMGLVLSNHLRRTDCPLWFPEPCGGGE